VAGRRSENRITPTHFLSLEDKANNVLPDHTRMTCGVPIGSADPWNQPWFVFHFAPRLPKLSAISGNLTTTQDIMPLCCALCSVERRQVLESEGVLFDAYLIVESFMRGAKERLIGIFSQSDGTAQR